MKKNKSNFSTILIVLLLIGIGVLASMLYDKQAQLDQEKHFSEAIVDSLQTYKDNEGNYISRISTIQAQNSQYFLRLKSSDSTIIALQKKVADIQKDGGLVTGGSSVTLIGRETNINVTVGSLNSTLGIRSYVNLDGWIVGSILARPDSTEINLQVYDDFAVRLDYEPQGFLGLGKPKPFTELTSKSPYSKTKVLRTYEVSMPPEPNLIIGPALTWGWGGWVAGISATYPLFKFRL